MCDNYGSYLFENGQGLPTSKIPKKSCQMVKQIETCVTLLLKPTMCGNYGSYIFVNGQGLPTSKIPNKVITLHFSFLFDAGIMEISVQHDDSKG